MQYALLPVFLVELFLKECWSGVRILLSAIATPSFELVSIGLAIVLGATVLGQMTAPKTLESTPTQQSPLQQLLLRHELRFWELAHNLQPTHHDILVNLATLSAALGEGTQSAQFKKQIEYFNPN